MMHFAAVITLFPDLEVSELTAWIEQRWVRPESSETELWVFQDIDIARVRLIYDLRRNLDTPEETIPVLLSLLDHVYELRRKLRAVAHALEDQPPEVRASILAILGDDATET